MIYLVSWECLANPATGNKIQIDVDAGAMWAPLGGVKGGMRVNRGSASRTAAKAFAKVFVIGSASLL
jgi:hypothetical protein